MNQLARTSIIPISEEYNADALWQAFELLELLDCLLAPFTNQGNGTKVCAFFSIHIQPICLFVCKESLKGSLFTQVCTTIWYKSSNTKSQTVPNHCFRMCMSASKYILSTFLFLDCSLRPWKCPPQTRGTCQHLLQKLKERALLHVNL